MRRPPTLSLQDTPFVPRLRGEQAEARDVMDEVDRRWQAMCTANPAFHDGRMCHVLGVHRNGHGGATIHVMDCAYRFYAVQDEDLDLGVRHLGVKSISMHEGRVLMGRRSMRVRAYPGMWEFAPGGVIEPGRDPVDVLRSELDEETGLAIAGEPTPVAILYDQVVRSWEIIYRITVVDATPQPRTDEYIELGWFQPNDLPEPLSPASVQLAGL